MIISLDSCVSIPFLRLLDSYYYVQLCGSPIVRQKSAATWDLESKCEFKVHTEDAETALEASLTPEFRPNHLLRRI